MWGWEIQICTQILDRGAGHVISRMRNDDLHCTGNLEPNISKNVRDMLGHYGAPTGSRAWGVEW